MVHFVVSEVSCPFDYDLDLGRLFTYRWL